MTDAIFERFLSPADRAKATCELADRGAAAIPLLVALFDGSARNGCGIQYRQLGTPLDCGLVAAQRLRATARPLEPFLLAELLAGHVYAAGALGALGALSDESVSALAKVLCTEALEAYEAARALYLCGAADHILVKDATASSATAARTLALIVARG